MIGPPGPMSEIGEDHPPPGCPPPPSSPPCVPMCEPDRYASVRCEVVGSLATEPS